MALLALNQDDPLFGANMALAAGLLQGNFGAGLQGFSGAMREGRQDAMRKQQFDLETEVKRMAIEKAKREAAQEQKLINLQKQFFSAGAPGMAGTADVNSALPAEMQIGAMPPMAARQPQFDVKGYTGAALNKGLMNPIEAIKLQQSMVKDAPINKLDVKDFTPASVAKFSQSGNYADLERMDKLHFADTGGGVTGMNPFTGKPVGSVPKSGDPFKDLVLADGNGGMRPNSPLINAKQGIAKAGATSVRIENKTGESLAKEIGPMMAESQVAATGAAQQIDAANRIVSAVDTNKVFAGPLATTRLKLAQWADVLNLGGKDDAEKIANTRSVVRGLAEMTLQGRKQMRGQGAITESESALAEKAISGNIDDLTPSEIKQLATASARSAKFVYGQHQQRLNVVKNNPNMAQMAPFYEPLALPADPVAPSAAVTPDWVFKDGKLVHSKR